MIYCLQRREEIPSAIVALANYAHQPFCYFEDAQYSLFQIIVNLCTLRHAEKSGELKASELVRLASEIDSSMVFWVSNLPECLNFNLVIDTTGTSLDGYFHNYKNCSDARLWGFYRCARILANAVITRAYANSPSLSYMMLPGSVLSSTKVISDLCGDICASVPYFILSSPDEVADVNGKNFVWPLYVVATSSVVTIRIRCWVIDQLQKISRKSAILQGAAIANVLSSTWEIMDWRNEVPEVSENTYARKLSIEQTI